MNEMNITNEQIREYLLGRISDEEILLQIEDLLFEDDEFCERIELAEDELINDFVFGKFNAKDQTDFEETLENNSERKSKVLFTQKLKETINEKPIEQRSTFFDSIKAFFRQPLYAGSFAVLLIALVSTIILFNNGSNDEFAELQEIYKTERPVNARISDFEYAPFNTTRSETTDEANKNKLRLLENKLLEAVENKKDAASFHALGVFYLTQGKFEDAIKNLEKAIEIESSNAKYRNDLGTAYFEFAKNGKAEKRLENFARANEEFTKAFEQDGKLFESLFNKGLVLEELNLPKQAEETWQKYLELDKNSKWTDEAKKNLERLKTKESGFKTNEQIFDEFIKAYQAKDEKRFWQIHLETKGIFTGVSIHQQLTKKYLEALKQNDERQADEYLTTLKKIGEMESEQHSDFFFKDLAEYYKTVENEQIDGNLQAKNLLDEGVKLVYQQKFTESIEKFRQSENKFSAVGNTTESNIARFWVGEMLPDVNKLDESRKILNEVIKKSENTRHKILIPISYYWLSINDFREGLFSKAIQNGQASLNLAEEIENLYEISHSSDLLVEQYFEFGEIQKALPYHDISLKYKGENYSNKGQIKRILDSLTESVGNLGYENTAVDSAKESVSFSKTYLSENESVNDSLDILVDVLGKSNKFDEAIIAADESILTAKNRGEKVENFHTIASAYYYKANLLRIKSDCNSALTNFEKSLEYYQKVPEMTFNLLNVHQGKLLCLQKLGRKVEFQNELQKVLELSEKNRKNIREDSLRQTFFENVQIVYDVAIENALDEKNYRQAFEFSEKSKARSLLDFVKSEKTITELESEFGEITDSLTIEEIQKLMPNDGRILQYALLENRLGIWIITKDSFDFVETKIDKKGLDQKIDEYRKAILSKADVKKKAQDLYEILIPKNLPNDKTLCLILDKSLNQIPFASLVSTDGKYLIEKYGIVQSPSSSVFVYAFEKGKKFEKNSDEQLLIFGNPRFDREENPNLEDLPGAEAEADSIAKNYTDARKFVGEKASKSSFLNNFENSEIIHFAGHFVSNEQSRQNSKLVFADDSLRVFELSEKKLNKTKIVILSACDTGLEKLNNSEGAIGIGRTFLALGTPLVASSLWKVDSEATKDLMITFHQNRKAQNVSSIEALRQAQLEMLKTNNFNHPFYWSAFTMTGGLVDY